jgi:hypothetical protein
VQRSLLAYKGHTLVGEIEPIGAASSRSPRWTAVTSNFHAYRDGRVVEHRKVEEADSRWGSRIQ